jgi:hypothetical protein
MKWLKSQLVKLVNLYNTNTKFHSFVQGLVGAIIGAGSEWLKSGGGLPTTTTALYGLGAFVLKYVWSWWTRWAQNNVATKGVVAKG